MKKELFTVDEMVIGLVKDYKLSISKESIKDSSIISQITECINLGTVKPRVNKNGSVKLIDGVYKFVSDNEVARKSKGDTKTLTPVVYKLNDKKEVVRIANNYQVVSPNKKVITLADYDKADLYIEGFLDISYLIGEQSL